MDLIRTLGDQVAAKQFHVGVKFKQSYAPFVSKELIMKVKDAFVAHTKGLNLPVLLDDDGAHIAFQIGDLQILYGTYKGNKLTDVYTFASAIGLAAHNRNLVAASDKAGDDINQTIVTEFGDLISKVLPNHIISSLFKCFGYAPALHGGWKAAMMNKSDWDHCCKVVSNTQTFQQYYGDKNAFEWYNACLQVEVVGDNMKDTM